ncbi:unnamed protein product [Fusarium graminearum]|uniref:Chromosome 3, complete genome n=1 Tax=Gibberella zeae (strain ATCC MYA-4620 / CBS 123657 / FGSC 9075 / NRRL 31084 / PH-1) TaxID=229533 RepID=A0A098DWX2_GIBZE|nr:unnamed protein product [Fusarium graminearum]
MSPEMQDPSNRRSSCDQCSTTTRNFRSYPGQKKLKCDGGYPYCGRCSSISETCIYSAKLPMGRPKKRKISEVPHSSAESRTSPSTLATSITSETGSEVGRRSSFDNCQHMSDDTTLEMSLGPDTNVDPTLLAFETDPGQQSCACLANLYLSLEEIRKADDLPFTSRLSVLRHLTTTAGGIIQCQICPTKFLWAMQNAQLLNTLIISLGEGYKKIVKSVEDEMIRAQEAKEAKILTITEDQQPGTPGFQMNLDPEDWQNIANKAIKAELFGTKHSTTTSFVEMLQWMEDRQNAWHSGHTHLPPGIGTRMHHQMHEKEPHCVSVVKHTRDMHRETDSFPHICWVRSWKAMQELDQTKRNCLWPFTDAPHYSLMGILIKVLHCWHLKDAATYGVLAKEWMDRTNLTPSKWCSRVEPHWPNQYLPEAKEASTSVMLTSESTTQSKQPDNLSPTSRPLISGMELSPEINQASARAVGLTGSTALSINRSESYVSSGATFIGDGYQHNGNHTQYNDNSLNLAPTFAFNLNIYLDSAMLCSLVQYGPPHPLERKCTTSGLDNILILAQVHNLIKTCQAYTSIGIMRDLAELNCVIPPQPSGLVMSLIWPSDLAPKYISHCRSVWRYGKHRIGGRASILSGGRSHQRGAGSRYKPTPKLQDTSEFSTCAL